MNTLKALFVCALFTVTGCAGIEPTEEIDSESEEIDGASEEIDGVSEVESSPAAAKGGGTSDAKPVCWDDGVAYCCGSGGMICCLIEGQMYCG